MKKLCLLMILSILTLFSDAQVMLSTVEVVATKTSNTIDTIYGIDVSFYQGKIDYSKIDSTIKFVIIKVSEGGNKVDNKFKYNWNNCPLIKGGYHFFRPQVSGVTQAKLFLSQLELDSGMIKPVIDVEHTSFWNTKKNRKTGVKHLKQMIDYIKEKTGVEPIIYTGGFFWNSFITPYYNGVHTLWVADYRKVNGPSTPINMDWTIWQFTCKGKVSGIKTKVDMNICLNIDEILID